MACWSAAVADDGSDRSNSELTVVHSAAVPCLAPSCKHPLVSPDHRLAVAVRGKCPTLQPKRPPADKQCRDNRRSDRMFPQLSESPDRSDQWNRDYRAIPSTAKGYWMRWSANYSGRDFAASYDRGS